jgi:hypothetical protein
MNKLKKLFSKKQYCFVSSKNRFSELDFNYTDMKLLSKAKIGKKNQYFFSREPINYFYNVINDFDDFSIDLFQESINQGKLINFKGESFISFASSMNHYFGAVSDYWGIFPHFYDMSDDTFVCSNSLFLIAIFLNRDLSKKSIYELLFFYSTLKNRTLFKQIKRLLPNQSLIYNAVRHNLSFSEPFDHTEDLIYGSKKDCIVKISLDKFFDFVKIKMNDRTAAISFSYGSDSRLILSCINYYKIKKKLFTFGENDWLETRLVKEFVKKYALDWELFDVSGFEKYWMKNFCYSCVLSNGYINPFRTHYVGFYDFIPSEYVIFEGYSGEFVRGEVCPDAWISNYHMWAIQGQSISSIIEENFNIFRKDFKKNIIEYISDTHGMDLLNINTSDGMRKFQAFMFDISTTHSYASHLLLANENHDIYMPQLSPQLLRAMFAHKNSIIKSNNLCNYHPKVIPYRVLSEIIKYTDLDLYDTEFLSNLTFKEVLEGNILFTRVKKKLRSIKRKLKYKKMFAGQIDNRRVNEIIKKNALNFSIVEMPYITNRDILKHVPRIAMLNIIKELLPHLTAKY